MNSIIDSLNPLILSAIALMTTISAVIVPSYHPLYTPRPTMLASPSATTKTSPSPSTPAATPNSPKTIKVGGVYSYFNQNITYSLSFPTTGGDVNGDVTGLCQGKITGKFLGGEEGKIEGVAKADCKISFVTQPLEVNFNGKVYPKDGKMDLNLEGSPLIIPSGTTITLYFDPVN